MTAARSPWRLLWLCCGLLCTVNTLAADTPFTQAQQLLQQGKASEAYALLAPMEFDQAGDPDFDYTLAMAALGAGKPDKATLALERLLAVNPDSRKGRLAMARAFYELGDDARASVAFQRELDSSADPSIQQAIASYLARIKTRQTRRTSSLSAYLELGGGYDSNINAAPDREQITTPDGGVMTLGDSNSQTSDAFWGSAAGVNYQRHLSKQNRGFASASIRQRNHFGSSSYDNYSLFIQGGWEHALPGNQSLRLDLLGGSAYQDGAASRNTLGGNVEWRSGQRWRGGLQYLRLRHPDNLRSNDVNLYTMSATWSQTSLYLTGVAGLESDINDRDDGSKTFVGLRLGWQQAVGQRSQILLNLSAISNRYDQENLYFMVKRADNRYDAGLTWNAQLSPHWSVRPQISYSLSQSNMVLYDYNRIATSLNLRYHFGD